MSWLLLLFLFSSVWSGSFCANKVVKIVQEPANYGGLNSFHSNNPRPKSTLKPFRKETPFSGPHHLKKLYGKCFSLTDNSYKYELCPFFNITQHEQTWRWNAFHGILGIWKEWSIVNNTFEAMVMSDGDQCPGNLRRESKIYFKCAKSNRLVSVTEPRTCRYDIKFETPLACPLDAFLVYPMLPADAQREWEDIEESFYHEELTVQGYEKLRRHLFIRVGLLTSPEDDQKKTKELKDIVHIKNNASFVPETKFHTKEECFQAYSDLLHKYLELRRLLEKQNSSEKAEKISQISNVEFATSNDALGARGDTGVVRNATEVHKHQMTEEKQSLTESPT